MKKLISTASILALMAVGPAFAQDTNPSVDPAQPSMGETQVKPSSPSTDTTSPASPASPQMPSTSAMNETGSANIGQGELRVSKLIGSQVRNGANETIGNINDVLLTRNGQIESVIVGVGGFLGLGEKNVALQFSELKFDVSDPNRPTVTAAATSDALAAAPEWKPADKAGSSTTRPSTSTR